MNINQLFSQTVIVLLCLAIYSSCQRPEPEGQYFCKSEEVYILSTPFDLESALIVMYKGDELLLMGDTTYQPSLDSQAVDSSIYYVKVKAKRGVVGWVNAVDLQQHKPKVIRVKAAKKIEKKAAVVKEDKVKIKTDAFSNTQLLENAAGIYRFQQEELLLECELLSIDSLNWKFKLRLSTPFACRGELEALAKANGLKANYIGDDCPLLFRIENDGRLLIEEQNDCKIRGTKCSFNGRLTKVDSLNRDSSSH